MYIYCDSSKARGYLSTPSRFTFSVPNISYLAGRECELALTEIRLKRPANLLGYYAVHLNILELQPAYNNMVPIVRTFSLSKKSEYNEVIFEHLQFTDRNYVPIQRGLISDVMFSLENVDGHSPDSIDQVWCVFHMRAL